MYHWFQEESNLHCPRSNPNFPRYNIKCSGKHDTTWNIPRCMTFSPLYIFCYIAENRFPLGQWRACHIVPPVLLWRIWGVGALGIRACMVGRAWDKFRAWHQSETWFDTTIYSLGDENTNILTLGWWKLERKKIVLRMIADLFCKIGIPYCCAQSFLHKITLPL